MLTIRTLNGFLICRNMCCEHNIESHITLYTRQLCTIQVCALHSGNLHLHFRKRSVYVFIGRA
jgi:hypothetical protein